MKEETALDTCVVKTDPGVTVQPSQGFPVEEFFFLKSIFPF